MREVGLQLSSMRSVRLAGKDNPLSILFEVDEVEL